MRGIGAMSFAIAVLLFAAWTISDSAALAGSSRSDPNVAMLDDCDPSDDTWAEIGGCTLKPHEGDVTRGEFFALAFTPLGPGVLIGHPSWRNQPSHLSVGQRIPVRVVNRGGREHTFTEVANFGGGFIPILNGSLAPASECLEPPQIIAPGQGAQLSGLGPGLHKFQCCIHPWMRATIRVK